jgi:hypothetical protein
MPLYLTRMLLTKHTAHNTQGVDSKKQQQQQDKQGWITADYQE